MPRTMETENRSGPRYLATLEVKAEWDEPSGTHIVAEGTTENVGPEGTLVHLPRQLPQVGSRVRLEVAVQVDLVVDGVDGAVQSLPRVREGEGCPDHERVVRGQTGQRQSGVSGPGREVDWGAVEDSGVHRARG